MRAFMRVCSHTSEGRVKKLSDALSGARGVRAEERIYFLVQYSGGERRDSLGERALMEVENDVDLHR